MAQRKGRPKGSKDKIKNPPPKSLIPYLFKKGDNTFQTGRFQGISIRAFNKEFVVRNIVELMNKPVEELNWMIEAKQVTSFQQMIISVIFKAINLGDPERINFLLAKTIGTLSQEEESEYKKTFTELVKKARLRKEELIKEGAIIEKTAEKQE